MPQIKRFTNELINPDSTYLQTYTKNVTSQFGEDGLIEKIFEIIGAKGKWCVEIGGLDGKQFSNTWALINRHAWNAVLIEKENTFFSLLADTYAHNDRVIPVRKLVDFSEGENSLDAILADTGKNRGGEGQGIPLDFDFLCIDVDGCDLHIWDAVKKYRPRLVQIEFNPSIPNNIAFIQDADMGLNHGSSLRAMIQLGLAKGYELVATTPVNAFFVLESEFARFDIDDNSIDAMHDPDEFGSSVFQLYDGSLVYSGATALLWKDVPIRFDDLQVLPKALRTYRGA